MSRIIYAEDDELVGALVSNALMDAGHAVGWLPDGEKALMAMRRRTPDLVILDWDMPELSGEMVLRAMRIDLALACVPVLMLTGITDQGSQDIAYYDGADDYLTKPFEIDELIVRVEDLLRGKKRGSTGLCLPAHGTRHS